MPLLSPAARPTTRGLQAAAEPSAGCSLLRACSDFSSSARRSFGGERRRDDRLELAVRRLLRSVRLLKPAATKRGGGAQPSSAPVSACWSSSPSVAAGREYHSFRLVHLNCPTSINNF